MTPREHLENFMDNSEFHHLEDIYEDIVVNNDFSYVNEIYDALIEEINKDRPLFVCPKEQRKEFEEIRDTVFNMKEDLHTRGCMATALFDALVIEKIKTYAMSFDAPAILADSMHDEYLDYLEEDDEE